MAPQKSILHSGKRIFRLDQGTCILLKTREWWRNPESQKQNDNRIFFSEGVPVPPRDNLIGLWV